MELPTVEWTNEELIAGLRHIAHTMERNGHSYYQHVAEEAIKALEQQPCIEDYPTCTECEHYDRDKHYCPRFCQVIKDALAEAQLKKGKWIVISCEPTDIFKCSECGMRVINPYRYCHSCGAKMEVEDAEKR